ncbi:MAG TPA: hypothetical protein VFB38_19440 [Chthonomonadaceae bacterium]|nr:hypothetical protein [Chthonomonadaceae bacterium]
MKWIYLATLGTFLMLSPGLAPAQKAHRTPHAVTRAAAHRDRAYTPRPGSREERAILAALRQARPNLRRPVPAALMVDALKVHHGWAYLSVTPTAPGNNPDAPHYAREAALLHQVKGRWKLV